MYHFIGLIWDSRNSAAKEIAWHLSELLKVSTGALRPTLLSEGAVIFSEPPRTKALCVYKLAGNRGVIFGRIFPHLSDSPCLPSSFEFDDRATEEILRCGGQGLIDGFWGNYVAFLTSGASGFSCQVIRSCAGGIPCYRMRHKDVEIVFSDLGDLAPLRFPPFTLNHHYIAAYIFNHQIQVRACGYTEITEVLAGDSVSFQEHAVHQFSIWDPRKVVRSANIDDYESAEIALRRVAQQCIGGWAKIYNNVLVSLSGGFDSAVVLGCLRESGTSAFISCFNQCLEGTADDERDYARLAANRVDVPLVERPWSNPTMHEKIFSFPIAPKPCTGHLDWWFELEVRNEIARSVAAEAIVTGQGGDHLFWAPRNFPIAADYVARHGLDGGFPRVVMDAARLYGYSYFSIVSSAIKLGYSATSWIPEEIQRMKPHFVNSESLPDRYIEYASHPWLSEGKGLAGIAKTKQAQIFFLANLLNRHQHFPRAEFAYQEHPLLSQPLIELCLEIPVYLLVRGGRRRAMARRAFSDLVPRAILDREDKGDTSERARSVIRQNQTFFRDLLQHGLLVRSGIISWTALKGILADGQSFREEEYWPLRACITAEIWAQAGVLRRFWC